MSLTIPTTIRVLMTATGQIQTVDFKTYVKCVVPNEWYASWNPESLKSGAMCAKTYAWYWILHPRHTNYDVTDSSAIDQVYKPNSNQPSTDQATEDTWDIVMTRNNEIFLSQYDSGTKCSLNPLNSGRLSQWGSQLLAESISGCSTISPQYNYQQILHYYYDPAGPINFSDITPNLGSIKIPDSANIVVGASQQLVPTCTDQNNNVINCPILNWSSLDASIAKVANGLVTGVSAGITDINASFGTVVSNNSVITVTSPIISSIIISPSESAIKIGKTVQLKATCHSNGNIVTCPPLKWVSSNPSVATVNSTGLVKGISRGTTNITASYGAIVSNISTISTRKGR